MTKEARMTKPESPLAVAGGVNGQHSRGESATPNIGVSRFASFGIRHSFVIGYFGIRHCPATAAHTVRRAHCASCASSRAAQKDSQASCPSGCRRQLLSALFDDERGRRSSGGLRNGPRGRRGSGESVFNVESVFNRLSPAFDAEFSSSLGTDTLETCSTTGANGERESVSVVATLAAAG